MLTAHDIESRFRNYASPVFATAHRAANTSESDVALRERRFVDAFEAGLKYCCIILVSQYRKDRAAGVIQESKERTDIDAALRALVRPSLGMYAGLLRNLLSLYSALPRLGSASALFADFSQAYAEDPLDDEVVNALRSVSALIEYPVPRGKKTPRDLVEMMVVYRNRLAHGACPPRQEFVDRVKNLEAVITSFLESIRPLASLPLLELGDVVSRGQAQEFHLCEWCGQTPKHVTRQESELEPFHPSVVFEDGSSADLFPFCFTERDAEHHNRDGVFFLNNVKKSRIDFLAYHTGRKKTRGTSDPEFAEILSAISMLEPPEEASVPLRPVPESVRRLYVQAEAAYSGAVSSDADVSDAISQLTQAVDDCPWFREAVELLASLLEGRRRFAQAHKHLENYLLINPKDTELLLRDAQVLMHCYEYDRAEEQCLRIVALVDESTDPVGAQARELLDEMAGTPQKPPERKEFLLPYEFIFARVAKPGRSMLVLWAAVITILATIEATLFALANDLVMTFTVIAMNMLWGCTVWATFKIRRLLVDSRANFIAFLKSSEGVEVDQVFSRTVRSVFTDTPEEAAAGLTFLKMLKFNQRRVIVALAGSALGVAWIFSVAQFASYEATASLAFLVAGLTFFMSFVYLVHCLYCFHFKFLRNLEHQQIQFSLVQHPKLSIRYLSRLSRKVTVPLLAIYALASITVYLGPFLANLAFVGALLVFSFMCCFLYYNTIFLVRRIIVANKWRLIARFSNHFNEPFNRLIARASKKDMDRINELVQIRDFLDSMDVWAEKKSTLVLTSLGYALTILFSTVGVSNLMTRTVTPFISQYANEKTDSEEVVQVVQPTDVASPLTVSIRDVDDTVIVCYGPDLDQLATRVREALKGGSEGTYEGFRRCDWANGMHGAMDLEIPAGERRHVLVVGYNKVYHGLPGMGGGKFSFGMDVKCGETRILRRRQFVRINNRKICYTLYVASAEKDGAVEVRYQEGLKIDSPVISQLTGEIADSLGRETDASVSIKPVISDT